MADKTQKAYGKSLPDDQIRSIMGRAIPPEWTVNLLAIGKETTCWFEYLEYQLDMYRRQWQADQQKQTIAKMAGKMPGKSNDGKRKNNERNHHSTNGGHIGGRQVNNGRGGRGRGSNNSENLKTIECFNCGKKSLFYRLLRTKKE
jgi:hypothetical protein